MDIDAIEDYLQFIEKLERHPGYFPIHNDQDSVPDSPEDPSDRRSVSHGAPSYDLSGVWPSPSSGPRERRRVVLLLQGVAATETLSEGKHLLGNNPQWGLSKCEPRTTDNYGGKREEVEVKGKTWQEVERR
ncbi:hypothetical protein PIB30_092400 [Stylosanthes scabra]|uniref:Uncharacterized protein n=1 Tax=Stylosanthes scabra TaxID=79078 RepID=A0ABU6RVD0_9FABA|nr:hypothetical protein [Stylosanthes scabra]